MITIQSFVPADYTVWAISGAIFITGALDFLFSLGSSNDQAQLSTRDPRRRPSRNLMFLAMAFWGASLILPLNVLWGPSSVVAGTNVTSWTSQGWMCRIFITLCLGICAPLACILGAVILFSLMYDLEARDRETGENLQHGKFNMTVSSMTQDHPVVLALLISLPFSASQAVIAWITLTLTYEDKPIEESPTSLLATWLSPFAVGNTLQCDSASLDGDYPCTACVFPAGSVLVHGTWTIMYVLALSYAGIKLRTNTAKKTLWFTFVLVTSSVAGLLCMGISIYFHDPFTWTNQGLWLGWVATVLTTSAAISYAA